MADQVVDMQRGLYRRVYAGFIDGERICSVSIEAEAWFWRLHAIADDFGNFPRKTRLLKNKATGLRDLTDEQIEGWMVELQSAGLCMTYTSKEVYGHIIGFLDAQPAGRNGKRIQKYPREPSGARGNPGESEKVPDNPGAENASHSHSQSHTHTHHHSQRGGGAFHKNLRTFGVTPDDLMRPVSTYNLIHHWWDTQKNGRKNPIGALASRLRSGLPNLPDNPEAVLMAVNAGKIAQINEENVQDSRFWLDTARTFIYRKDDDLRFTVDELKGATYTCSAPVSL